MDDQRGDAADQGDGGGAPPPAVVEEHDLRKEEEVNYERNICKLMERFLGRSEILTEEEFSDVLRAIGLNTDDVDKWVDHAMLVSTMRRRAHKQKAIEASMCQTQRMQHQPIIEDAGTEQVGGATGSTCLPDGQKVVHTTTAGGKKKVQAPAGMGKVLTKDASLAGDKSTNNKIKELLSDANRVNAEIAAGVIPLLASTSSTDWKQESRQEVEKKAETFVQIKRGSIETGAIQEMHHQKQQKSAYQFGLLDLDVPSSLNNMGGGVLTSNFTGLADGIYKSIDGKNIQVQDGVATNLGANAGSEPPSEYIVKLQREFDKWRSEKLWVESFYETPQLEQGLVFWKEFIELLDVNQSKYAQTLVRNKLQNKVQSGSLGKDGRVLLNLEFYEEKAFAKSCMISSKMEEYIYSKLDERERLREAGYVVTGSGPASKLAAKSRNSRNSSERQPQKEKTGSLEVGISTSTHTPHQNQEGGVPPKGRKSIGGITQLQKQRESFKFVSHSHSEKEKLEKMAEANQALLNASNIKGHDVSRQPSAATSEGPVVTGPVSVRGVSKDVDNGDGNGDIDQSPDIVLTKPYTRQQAEKLLQHFSSQAMTNKQKRVSLENLEQLLRDFTQTYYLRNPDPVVSIHRPKEGRVIVVGDTHGQLQDVLYLFRKLGPPSLKNVYLFNGDIADRGNCAVEIFILLCLFYLAEPGCVYINRGNHENESLNMADTQAGGGFYQEVCRKYCADTYLTFVDLFTVLNLAAVFENQIFIVHAGLTRNKDVTIDYLQQLDHTSCTIPSIFVQEEIEDSDRVWMDILWSDPISGNPEGGFEESPRGLGVLFGVEVTRQFCETNRLKYIIRSHQLPESLLGYEWLHDGLVLTLFSASNYCRTSGNKGAVLLFDQGCALDDPEIFEYMVAPLSKIRQFEKEGVDWEKGSAQYYDEVDIEARVMAAEMIKMQCRFLEEKPLIWNVFVERGKRKILLIEFLDVLEQCLGSNLPWLNAILDWGLIDLSAPDLETQTVDIMEVLTRFQVALQSTGYAKFKSEGIKQCYEEIANLDQNLEGLFLIFDQDGSGEVDYAELKKVLGAHTSLSALQIDGIARCFFGRGEDDKEIDVLEFLGKFAAIYKSAKIADDLKQGKQDVEGIVQIIQSMALFVYKTPVKKIFGTNDAAYEALLEKAPKEHSKLLKSKNKNSFPSKMYRLFTQADTNHDGLVDLKEFVEIFTTIPGLCEQLIPNYDSASEGNLLEASAVFAKIFQYIDTSGDGNLNYLEFMEAFTVETSSEMQKSGDLMAEPITMTLFRYRQCIRNGCALFDLALTPALIRQYLDKKMMQRADEVTNFIKREDFVTVLEALNEAIMYLEQPLEQHQIENLAYALADEQGIINFHELLSAFVFQDKNHPGNHVLLAVEQLEDADVDI